MVLLNGCQTFIGVLATLIVLCIILDDKSNFIHKILAEVKERVQKDIDKLDKETSFERIDDVSDKSEYKLLIHHIKNLEATIEAKRGTPDTEKALKKATAMDLWVRSQFTHLKASVSGYLLKPVNDLLDKMLLSKEHVLSPCYALLCCLMVFLADDLAFECAQIRADFQIHVNDFIITFLTFFSIFSSVFWCIGWMRFFNRAKIQNVLQLPNKTNRKIKKTWKTNGKKTKITWVSTFIAIFILYTLCIFLAPFFKNIWCQRVFIFFIGSILPLTIIAIIKSLNHGDDYTYTFCFGHFFRLCGIALLLSAITLITSSYYPPIEGICFYYNSFTFIRLSMQILILCSGLIFPLLMPYIGFTQIHKKFKKISEQRNDLMQKELEEINFKLSKFCKEEIPMPK